VTDGAGRPLIADGLGRWLRAAAPAGTRGAVAIALVSDRVMHAMNRGFRGVDRPTDVLSFGRPEESMRPTRGTHFLGDIAIAKGVAARQAREQGHSVGTELRILALHGLLHLLGYDHHADRGEMARVEEQLRRRAGLPAGLIARAGRSRSQSRRAERMR